jgi:hypothetical protein
MPQVAKGKEEKKLKNTAALFDVSGQIECRRNDGMADCLPLKDS